jgi:hypothetical protein
MSDNGTKGNLLTRRALGCMASQHPTGFDLALGFGMAGIHAGFTLWHRLPMLAAACTPQGKTSHENEVSRMVSEKTSAFLDGVLEAQREIVRLSVEVITGRLAFEDMPHVAASVGLAGMQPAFQTVKANSRRLNQRS